MTVKVSVLGALCAVARYIVEAVEANTDSVGSDRVRGACLVGVRVVIWISVIGIGVVIDWSLNLALPVY